MKNANLAHWIVSAASLAIAAVSLVLWMRAPRGDQREIVLRDDDGRARIRLIAEKAGARVELLDENEHVRLSLIRDASSTSVMLNRATASTKGIELVVPDRADSAASQASVTIYSQDTQHAATLAAATEAWLSLTSGQGTLQLTQVRSQGAINVVNATNWAKLEVGPEKAAFSTEKPLSVDLYGGHQLIDGRASLPSEESGSKN